MNDYEHLSNIAKENKTLIGVSSILEWDQETGMPTGASEIRSEQLALLAGLIHKQRTSKKYESLLSKLIDIKSGKIIVKGLSSPQQAALHLWLKDYKKATALPEIFVRKFAKLSSEATVAWRKAKQDNQFSAFAPYLERIVTMCRKKADCIGFDDHPYDALLDEYEPDLTTKEVSALFKRLHQSLVSLLKTIHSSQPIDDRFLFGNFSEEKQLKVAKELVAAIGYDFHYGRLDTSSHPFSSSSHPTDSRITTRLHSSSLMSNISSTLHEGGHALYEMGLPTQYYGTPLCEAISLGFHESQSRWWEILIGQGKPFWAHFLPVLKKTFKGVLDHVSLNQFYKAINRVSPSLIRVDADEVTYNLHIIIRFEMEKALVEGSLAVKDVPEAWNGKMQQYLGITPLNDREGCLQDIHWAMGSIGYFPTYTIGNLYAAHLFLGFERDFPNWKKQLEKGEVIFIKEWLNQAVHQHGRRYSSKELLKKVTGKTFSEKAFVDYLNSKYQEIIY